MPFFLRSDEAVIADARRGLQALGVHAGGGQQLKKLR